MIGFFCLKKSPKTAIERGITLKKAKICLGWICLEMTLKREEREFITSLNF